MHSRMQGDRPVTTEVWGAGDAAPALVVPGGPCRDPEYLGDLAGIAGVRPLVVMHPRGTPRTGGRSRGWWNDAEDLVAIADALSLDAVDIVAHSAGTRLALAAAARFPDRVRSLLLITPPATWLTGSAHDGEILASQRNEPAVTAAAASMAAPTPTTEAGFQRAIRVEAPAGYARWSDLERAHSSVGGMTLGAALAWFDAIPDDAVERVLGAALPDTCVIAGDRDILTGVQPVRDYARFLGADLRMLAGCGHYPWVEQPSAFRAAAVGWLGR
jgi:pimeloyl-ACP methyl ester carboxylesterase